ncbi:MAG: zinc ribbon domain-containing protein [Thermodesulfovibrionia bacterium]|nr:zinc ribbon domain-containing protein [Thermodesulfovibrionia bacterium]
MPIYEYICNDCKKRFSLLRSILDSDNNPACTACGSLKVNKLISSFSTSSTSERSSPAHSCDHRGGG